MIKIICSSLLLLTVFLSESCSPGLRNKPDKDIDLKSTLDSVSFKLFSTGDRTYGFDVMVKGKVFIHQPVIPAWQGLRHFPSETNASAVAQLIVAKLRSNNFKFLLQKYEIDSLLGMDGKSGSSATQTTGKDLHDDIIGSAGLEDSFRDVTGTIPLLPGPPVKNKWSARGIVPFGNRAGAFALAIGKIVYVGSGERSDKVIKDFWGYNTVTGTWTCLAEVPANCFSSISFSIFKKGYVALGSEIGTSSGKFDKKVYQYNPDSNTWSKKRDFPGKGRIDAVSFVIGDKVYAGTGFSQQNEKDFYEYDPQKDSWKRVADFGGGTLHAAVGIGAGKNGFIVGGNNAADQRFCYEYKASEDRWERKSDLPGKGRYFLSGCDIDSNILMAGNGGTDGGQARYRDFFIYNTAENSWDNAQDYPVFKSGSTRAISANVDGKVFMGTGFGSYNMNDWNMYEYYFSLRPDTGVYDENVCYPLQYTGNWELYQECANKNCYAGAQIRSLEKLGNFCYKSRLTNDFQEIHIDDNNKATTKFILLPRYFSISTEKKPAKEVGLRLFFTGGEMNKTAAYFEKITGKHFSLDKIRVLQVDKGSDLHPEKDLKSPDHYKIIPPRLFRYGFNGQTVVADFSTATLQSAFYLGVIVQNTN